VAWLQRLNIRAIAEEAGYAKAWKASRDRSAHYSEQPVSRQAEFAMEGQAQYKAKG
jgi:transcriptional regulator GlxA family with amidase domain